jgi:D-cysteine desulfhydrase
LDKTIPRLTFGRDDFDLCHEFYGGEYGRFTPACMSAVALMKEMYDLRLEGTYTGKTFAALESDARQGMLADKVVVFWHTANSHPPPVESLTADYRQLPRSFHRYIERPLQELDSE